MKTYMPLNGIRWSRNSGSANCDMPQSVVFGRPGGGEKMANKNDQNLIAFCDEKGLYKARVYKNNKPNTISNESSNRS